MADLRTTYLGMELANPLVPSASPLSRDLDTALRLEDAGAAALVMYSLFEEELREQEDTAARFLLHQEIGFGEANSFLPLSDRYRHGLDDYLEQLRQLKQRLAIPVIASLNGVTLSGWLDHARALADAGADALELNVYYVAADTHEPGAVIEARYIELLRELRAQVSLPVVMKLSPHFSSVPDMVRRLENTGAAGVALFNRFYQPDIDLASLRVSARLQLSTSHEALLAMRWIAILYGRVGLTLAATGGIHTTEDAVKMLLAGADVTHLCSTLLLHGPARLAEIRAGLERWLDESVYESLEQMKGSVSQLHVRDPASYERVNYLAVLDSFRSAPGVRR